MRQLIVIQKRIENKVALYFNDGKRKEAYSFNEMKKLTNKAANVLRQQQI